MPTPTKRARPADFARLYLKSHSAAAMTCEAVLTFPGPDRQGDDVAPAGGDWAAHRDDPEFGRAVNYDHGVAVGRATRPDGAYGVELRGVADGAATHTLPVGTTNFFQTAADCVGLVRAGADTNLALLVAAQAFELISADVLTGVSLEFFPDDARYPGSMREIGRCPVEDRPAFAFDKWVGAGWAHTLLPVNYNARTLLPAYEKALKIARDGRVGGRPLSGPIRKSFSPLLAAPRRATVTGGYAIARKSMNPDELPPDDAAMPVSPDVPAANGPTPAAMHEALQAMQDLKAMADGYATSPSLEHPGGKDRFAELAALLTDEIGKFQGDAGGMFPDAGFESAAAEEADPEADPEAEADPFPTTDDGALMTKAFKKGYPRRFKKSDLKPALPVGKVLVDEAVMQGLIDAVARALPAR